jgi:hypothetical protein
MGVSSLLLENALDRNWSFPSPHNPENALQELKLSEHPLANIAFIER